MGSYIIPYDVLSATELGTKRVLFYIVSTYHASKVNDMVVFCGYKLRRNSDDVRHQLIEYLREVERKSFETTKQFAIIDSCEFDTIIQHSNGKSINQAVCLLLLAYIRTFIWKDPSRPRMYSWFKSSIANKVGIGRRSFDNAITALSNFDIIHYKTLEPYQDNLGNWHKNVTVFVNAHGEQSYQWWTELEKAAQYIQSQMVD